METAKIFDKLKDLQDILVEKYKLEAKIEETPKQLNAQEELLARLKKEYITKNTNYDSIKEKVAELKHELDDAVKLLKNRLMKQQKKKTISEKIFRKTKNILKS